MRVPLDRQSTIPLYKQIEEFFRDGIRTGNFPADTRLPATRQLASDLGVNRITIENAYAGLEADGLIMSRVGSGTFVLEQINLAIPSERDISLPWPLWQHEIKDIEVVENMPLTAGEPAASQNGKIIDFTSGIGDFQNFPIEEFRKVLQKVLRRDGISALGYGDQRGYAPLRKTIAQVLASQGLRTSAENILITAGSQQAITLVAQLLLKPGDIILVERPTYSGALNIFSAGDFKTVWMPMDDDGIRTEEVETILQKFHPKLIYTIPNFQNPTGTCLNSLRRRELIALADRYNVPILEDDFVGDLRYDGRAQPSLKALDPNGRVIYTSTFSKMLMPGLRVGFLVANGPVYDRLQQYKRAVDLATSNLIQRSLEAFITVGRYQSHLRRSRQIYRKRRNAMLAAIERYLPAGISLNPPLGGLYVWMQLPEKINASELQKYAEEEAVRFAPGRIFFSGDPEGERFIRLNFVSQTAEDNTEGIRRLGKAIDMYYGP